MAIFHSPEHRDKGYKPGQYLLQETELVDPVVELAKTLGDFDDFRRGLVAGGEAIDYADQHRAGNLVESPVTALTSMPAWEGSNSGDLKEHNLAWVLGAVIGAFAQRSGRDIDAIFEGRSE